FAAPPDQSLEWSDAGLDGAARFLRRFWKQCMDHVAGGDIEPLNIEALNAEQKALRRKLHETIAKVSDDIARRFTFNTAIAAVMELMNALAKANDDSVQGRALSRDVLLAAIRLLAPIVPHISHVLWRELGGGESVIDAPWPQFDESALIQDQIEFVVQVNGKLRGRVQVAADADRDTIEATARNDETVIKYLEDKTVVKVIVVPGKLVNIVVK
ncbi:MAG: class I tRNA ligase family protein, partial [Gammaproteobacteria bacterium]|nr:class I tRNA ligase family protein [Gammaproteobacteria bacterium]